MLYYLSLVAISLAEGAGVGGNGLELNLPDRLSLGLTGVMSVAGMVSVATQPSQCPREKQTH